MHAETDSGVEQRQAGAEPVLGPAGRPLPRPVVPGQPDSSNAGAVIAAIDAAVAFADAGRAAAVVTNPINKQVLYSAGFKHPGHTEYLAELAGGLQPDKGASGPSGDHQRASELLVP